MKNIKASFLIVFTVAAFFSCKKDDHVHAPGIGGSMSATISGTSWAATEANLLQPATGVREFYGARNSTGNSGTVINVHIGNFSTTGDYPFNGGPNWASLVQDDMAFVASNGKTTVTLDNDTFFKATFTFDAGDTLGGGNIKTVSGSFSYRKK